MTESGVFNIGEICRGCLSDNRDNLRSIFDANILESFILCTNVQVTELLFTNNPILSLIIVCKQNYNVDLSTGNGNRWSPKTYLQFLCVQGRILGNI